MIESGRKVLFFREKKNLLLNWKCGNCEKGSSGLLNHQTSSCRDKWSVKQCDEKLWLWICAHSRGNFLKHSCLIRNNFRDCHLDKRQHNFSCQIGIIFKKHRVHFVRETMKRKIKIALYVRVAVLLVCPGFRYLLSNTLINNNENKREAGSSSNDEGKQESRQKQISMLT